MAEPVEHGLTASEARIFREVVKRVMSGQFDLERDSQPRRSRGVIRATAVGDHAAGVTQAVQLCDSSWVAITGETPDAINDALIQIPDGTKLYLVPDDGRYAILQAFICDPEA